MTPAAGNVRQVGRVWKCGHTDIVRTRTGKLRCDECERERSRRRFRTGQAQRLATTAPAAPGAVDGDRVVLGADGIVRYRIDEWRARFGAPPMLDTPYDAWAE